MPIQSATELIQSFDQNFIISTYHFYTTIPFTSQHYKVSKSEVFGKVIPAADFLISADDICQKLQKKNWWMCIKAIASQIWDIF